MKKAINLQATVELADPNGQAQFQNDLQNAFTRANPGLTLSVKSFTSPDGQGKARLRVYIEGEQDPAADFSQLTSHALHQAIASLLPKPASTSKTLKTQARSEGGSRGGAVKNIQETENDDEDQGVILPPKNPAT